MKLLLITMISLFLTSGFATTITKGTYGADNRHNLYDASDMWREKARSVAVLISNNQIEHSGDATDGIFINSRSHKAVNRLCEGERFSSEPAPGQCTGFLVAPDLMLTASHCLRFESSIKDYKWLFDFGHFSESDDLTRSVLGNTYSSIEIVERKVDLKSGLEYLLVRLDRKVKDRAPLEFRTSGTIGVGEPVVVIGSPSGLPLKVADNAYVREIKNEIYFTTNTDTFGGNSGSPVFNGITGIVEGLLVRGDTDYRTDRELYCRRVVNCAMEECNGEDVVTIPNVDYFFK
ncbi:MAG: trypsin-like peptidase domain-containing protein [Bacteriovoracaceae bacterium]|nr:trypsin-like peptidase domain-containing protein [Bacteriovoracaceae bacterium]